MKPTKSAGSPGYKEKWFLKPWLQLGRATPVEEGKVAPLRGRALEEESREEGGRQEGC